MTTRRKQTLKKMKCCSEKHTRSPSSLFSRRKPIPPSCWTSRQQQQTPRGSQILSYCSSAADYQCTLNPRNARSMPWSVAINNVNTTTKTLHTNCDSIYPIHQSKPAFSNSHLWVSVQIPKAAGQSLQMPLSIPTKELGSTSFLPLI